MNIAVVAPETSAWEDEYRAGAILVKALARLGHRAWLVTSIFHEGRPAVDPDAVEKSVEGFVEVKGDPSGVPAIRVLSARPLLPGGRASLRSFAKVLMSLEERLGLDAVVVLSSFWNGPEEVAKWAAVRRALVEAGETSRRAAFIYVPLYFPRTSRLGPLERTSRAMWASVALPEVLRAADGVVVCCRAEAEELRRAKRFVESVAWVDPDVAEAVATARPLDVEGFDHVVAYVGPLEEERNVKALIKLADRLASVAAVAVAGAGSWEERLRREAARRRNLLVLGPLSLGELAGLMARATAAVDFSFYEPAAFRAQEFLYAGVPVAASPGSKAAWYISDGVEGIHLRNPDDVEAAARWIAELTRRPEVWEEMKRRARARGESLVAIATAKTVAKLAEEILTGGPRAP